MFVGKHHSPAAKERDPSALLRYPPVALVRWANSVELRKEVAIELGTLRCYPNWMGLPTRKI